MTRKILFRTFLTLWFAFWPGLCLGMILTHHTGWAIVGLCGLCVTLLSTFLALVRETLAHQRCHVHVQKAFANRSRLHAWRIAEVSALELESIADQLHQIPRDVAILPAPLAAGIDRHVRRLRAEAPDPPAFPMGDAFELEDAPKPQSRAPR